MTFVKKIYFTLLLSLLTLSGCIKEDRSNCPFTQIIFDYRPEKSSVKNLVERYIQNAKLFVYNSRTGAFVKKFNITEDILKSPEGLLIDLPDGEYKLVCWGNAEKRTSFVDAEDILYKALLSHVNYIDASSLLTTSDHLYFSATTIRVALGQEATYQMDFKSAHINLDVYIKGWNESVKPVVKFCGVTPQNDFKMQSVKPYTVTYMPDVAFDEKLDRSYIARFATLRFSEENPIVLHVENGSRQPLKSISLQDFIKKNRDKIVKPSQTFESQNELTVPIMIEFKGTEVVITLPQWESEDIFPGI